MILLVDEQKGALFSYVSLEERIPARHLLRKVAAIFNGALKVLDGETHARRPLRPNRG